ncbi:mitochondrial sodium/calcium exchanger protein isoform X2 [Dasypus novemcinctus]|nr:mitochondrial sodium/calcium exchanger protein isoform X2 [Dasypus novemcinctus]XP_058137377.1 mitochondrial sodium/calcium exchanger protein isoform X2 [Dasypus novemcinctus]
MEPVSGAGPGWPTAGAPFGPQFPASGVNKLHEVECRDVCGLNASDRCAFVRTTPDCRSDMGYLDYLEGAFCRFPPGLVPLAITLYALWLLYLFLILGVTAAKFFCPNLSAIATSLKLSHNVAGVTLLAFGNGAPDIFSALVAFSDARTASLALGALFGAGVLVTTVVAGGIAILRPFAAASRPFLRDIVFYMAAVFLTFTALYLGRVTLAWALGYLGFYVFYVFTVVLCTWIYRWQRRNSLAYSTPGTPELHSESEDDQVSSNTNSYDYSDECRPLFLYPESTAQILVRALNPLDCRKWRSKPAAWRALKVLKLPVEFALLLTVPVVDPDKDDRNWKRPLNCLHLAASPLFCVLTLQSGAYGLYELGGVLPVWTLVVIAGTAVAAVTFFATSNRRPPRFHWVGVAVPLPRRGPEARPRSAGPGPTGALCSPPALRVPGLPDERAVDQRGCHGGGEHPALPGRHLPAEQHRPGAHAAGLGQQHRRCLLGPHPGPPGLPADGILGLLRRHHLQYPRGRGAGLPAPDLAGPRGGEAGIRWVAGVGLGQRPGAQPRLLPGRRPTAVLPAEQGLRHLLTPLLPELPDRGFTHRIWSDSFEKHMNEALRQSLPSGVTAGRYPAAFCEGDSEMRSPSIKSMWVCSRGVASGLLWGEQLCRSYSSI